LLNVNPVAYIEQESDGKDESVIHSLQFLAEHSIALHKNQIKYGFDVVQVSVVPIFKKIISENYVRGTSFDPVSTDLLTNPNRGPPRLITIL